MEYLLMITWGILILNEAYWNWYKMERKKEYHKHWLWVIPRIVAGAVFLYLFILFDYYWYWSVIYLVGTHMLLFPELLNTLRGKPLGYLGDPDLQSPNKSVYDKILIRITYLLPSEALGRTLWFWFRFILFLFVVGNMILQGRCSWYELNHGGCL